MNRSELVCPHCASAITAQHRFCPHCTAPLTSYAIRPANPLALFRLWLIFAPTMLIAFVSAAVLIFGVIDGIERHATARFIGLAMSGFWVVLAATILWKSTRNYLRTQSSALHQSEVESS